MTKKELETRVVALEKTVESLQAKVNGTAGAGVNPVHWWTVAGGAGRFASDPGFEEMVRLGREYRESLHPDRQSKSKRKPQKQNDAGA
jgi:hypothetical protein